MYKLKVYIDTSVIGGCFDKEFEKYSNIIIDNFIKSKMLAVISKITLDELEKAPIKVIDKYKNIPDKNKIVIQITEDVINLADKYIANKVIPNKMFSDALHIV